MLAAGAGALGFWRAVRDVFPDTKEQRCWFHKTGNVLAALPKSAHPNAKKALAEIHQAEDKDHAITAAKLFAAEYGAKWPKAAAKITDDLDVLLAFYDYPAEHWVHLRTTNPIESTFATVRLRGSSDIRWGSWRESSGGEEHWEEVVVSVAVAAGEAAVELDDAVDRFGATVG